MAGSRWNAQSTAGRSKRLLAGLALLLFIALAIGASVSEGVGGVLLLVGLVVLVVGGVALVRGRARWAHLGSRGVGLIVALGGLGLVLVGGALAPPPSTPAASRLPLSMPSTSPPSGQATSHLDTTPAESSSSPLVAAPAPTTSLPALTTPAPAVITTTQPPPPRTTYAPVPKPQPPAAGAPPPPIISASPPQPAPVGSGSLGTAPIQKPPSGNFYRAGEFCPHVDAGKTTQDSSGRTLICTDNNGLRWEYA